jgi:anthranilate synthase component 2
MKALLIDAYDSFSHIIYQYLRMIDIDTDVVRSGELTPVEALEHDSISCCSGPGRAPRKIPGT